MVTTVINHRGVRQLLCCFLIGALQCSIGWNQYKAIIAFIGFYYPPKPVVNIIRIQYLDAKHPALPIHMVVKHVPFNAI